MAKKIEAIISINGNGLKRGYKVLGDSVEEIEEKIKSIDFSKNPVNWDKFKALHIK